MSEARTRPTARQAELTVRLVDELFGDAVAVDVGIRLWDGTRRPDDAPHPATLVLKHPSALRRMLLQGTEVAMAEAYLYDDIDIEGDAERIFNLAGELVRNAGDVFRKARIARALFSLPSGSGGRAGVRRPARVRGKRHSIERDRQAIAYHYDVSNDFYALWLDPFMLYSCAWFHTPEDTLETAQRRKLDYICRKLRLRPGMRLLDIGCGWGGLAMYAARHYEVDVTGITLSRPQVDFASKRIAEAGLSDSCRVLYRDYREVNEPEGYDALVSVGMFEHVGVDVLPQYFSRARELLKPEGVFLNHGIANRVGTPAFNPRSFSDTYVFPDGELTTIGGTLRAAEDAGFEIRDVESLREHYRLTLRHWVRRLEEHHDRALAYVDEPTYRIWRLYMAGSAQGFRVGRLNVYQTLLVKPGPGGRSGLPLTRADWYA